MAHLPNSASSTFPMKLTKFIQLCLQAVWVIPSSQHPCAPILSAFALVAGTTGRDDVAEHITTAIHHSDKVFFFKGHINGSAIGAGASEVSEGNLPLLVSQACFKLCSPRATAALTLNSRTANLLRVVLAPLFLFRFGRGVVCNTTCGIVGSPLFVVFGALGLVLTIPAAFGSLAGFALNGLALTVLAIILQAVWLGFVAPKAIVAQGLLAT